MKNEKLATGLNITGTGATIASLSLLAYNPQLACALFATSSVAFAWASLIRGSIISKQNDIITKMKNRNGR